MEDSLCMYESDGNNLEILKTSKNIVLKNGTWLYENDLEFETKIKGLINIDENPNKLQVNRTV